MKKKSIKLPKDLATDHLELASLKFMAHKLVEKINDVLEGEHDSCWNKTYKKLKLNPKGNYAIVVKKEFHSLNNFEKRKL